jgi:tetratricopeptide (TPR) repeat protein/class 3 adenylate cyclase
MSAPEGYVGILFADIVDSTKFAIQSDEQYQSTQRDPLYAQLGELVNTHKGTIQHEAGDGVLYIAHTADDAVNFAIDLQKWSMNQSFKLRIGVHLSETELKITEAASKLGQSDRAERLNVRNCYDGHTQIALAARIISSAQPGQLLISQHCFEKLIQKPKTESWQNRRFKSFPTPQTVYEITENRPSLGEPGIAFTPEWYRGEQNRFFDRPEIIEKAESHLLSKSMDGSKRRAVTLHGDGGFGKTRLGVHIAAKLSGEFNDGIKMIRFGGLKTDLDPELKFKSFVEELYKELTGFDVPEKTPIHHLLAPISEASTSKDFLLLVDNYESVRLGSFKADDEQFEVDEVLSHLLNLSSGIRILITSREKSGDWSHGIEIHEMEPGIANEFFANRCQKSFTDLNPSDQEAICKITDRCQRIPLYMELISMWYLQSSFQKLADGFGKFACPTGRSRQDSTPENRRHNARVNSFGYSLSLLEQSFGSDLPKQCFIALGAVSDPIPDRFVAQLLDQDEEPVQYALAALRDFHLARISSVQIGHESWLEVNSMHAMAIQEASEIIKSSGEQEAWNVRAVNLILSHGLEQMNQSVGFLLENSLASALPRLIQRTDFGELAYALRLWLLSNDGVARKALCELGSNVTAPYGKYVLGDIAFYEGDNQQARNYYDQAMPLFQAVNDPLGQANVLKQLGDIAFYEGDNQQARNYYDQAMPLFQAVNDPLGQANVLEQLGDIAFREGDNQQARNYYDQAMPLYQAAGTPLGQANVLKQIGDIAFREGDNHQARNYYDQAMPLYQAAGTPLGQANAFFSMYRLAVAVNQISQAISILNESNRLYEKVREPIYAGLTRFYLGRHSENGSPEQKQHFDLAKDWWIKAGRIDLIEQFFGS